MPCAKAYNEVKEKGASDATGHTRTPEETAVARFFSDAPANYWNRLMRELVVSHSLDLGDSARMFALVTMAVADTIITCWDTKIYYNVSRPITAIREGENDGNADTAGNPTWTSFFNSSNYTDYTSGANNVSGATTTILEHLFGDKVEFTLVSNAAGAVPRAYGRPDLHGHPLSLRRYDSPAAGASRRELDVQPLTCARPTGIDKDTPLAAVPATRRRCRLVQFYEFCGRPLTGHDDRTGGWAAETRGT